MNPAGLYACRFFREGAWRVPTLKTPSHSKRTTALNFRTFELSFGCGMEPRLLRTVYKGGCAKLAETTPAAHFE